MNWTSPCFATGLLFDLDSFPYVFAGDATSQSWEEAWSPAGQDSPLGW